MAAETRREAGAPTPTPGARRRFRVFARRLLDRWGPRALWRRLDRKNRRWVLVAAAVFVLLAPLWGLNLLVATLGHTVVFPLSPFFLREKVVALRTYAGHRATCWISGHPDIGPLIASAEVRYHLPRGLLAAVVDVESKGRPHRISAAGAMGPAQLMPDTARLLQVSDPFDSAAAVDGSARLLRRHLDHFHALRLAIAAYHAGPAAVTNGVPHNGITPEYVSRVMTAYLALRPRRPAHTRSG